MKRHNLQPDTQTDLETLARELALPEFDLLLIGDGSGTVYDKPAGWACIAYDRRKQQVTLHAGAVTGGTNNFAELIPYVQALWFYHQDHGQDPRKPVRVQIVSDSEVTVRCGSGRYVRRANGCLWAAVSWFEQNGYELGWRHVRRNSNAWSALMDVLAGEARRQTADGLQPRTLDAVLAELHTKEAAGGVLPVTNAEKGANQERA